ncbi:MAG: hypothetical protein FWF50_00230 [Defluviitaleaceae bacterium]|nr:hypothetical protein [Defluviitaleaceae bacterium]
MNNLLILDELEAQNYTALEVINHNSSVLWENENRIEQKIDSISLKKEIAFNELYTLNLNSRETDDNNIIWEGYLKLDFVPQITLFVLRISDKSKEQVEDQTILLANSPFIFSKQKFKARITRKETEIYLEIISDKESELEVQIFNLKDMT